jgi:hypothetical protein
MERGWPKCRPPVKIPLGRLGAFAAAPFTASRCNYSTICIGEATAFRSSGGKLLERKPTEPNDPGHGRYPAQSQNCYRQSRQSSRFRYFFVRKSQLFVVRHGWSPNRATLAARKTPHSLDDSPTEQTNAVVI